MNIYLKSSRMSRNIYGMCVFSVEQVCTVDIYQVVVKGSECDLSSINNTCGRRKLMCVHKPQIGCCCCSCYSRCLADGPRLPLASIIDNIYEPISLYIHIYRYCCLSLASSCCKHFDVLAEIDLPSSIFGQPQQEQLEADATGCKI